MNGRIQGRGERGEGRGNSIRRCAAKPQAAARSFIHHSSFIIHHSARKGISLLEVLISIFVLSIGLLGVLAIIPLGQMTIAEAVKADRAGACGRAAMRDIKVRRMLDYRSWYWEQNLWGWSFIYDSANNTFNRYPITDPTVPKTEIDEPDAGNAVQLPEEIGAFVIDPLGRAKGLPDIFYLEKSYEKGNTVHSPTISIPVLPRRTLNQFYLNSTFRNSTTVINGSAFYWLDDLEFETTTNTIDRPRIDPSVGYNQMSRQDYSCLFTVTPSSSERWLPILQRHLFDVTVAVFYQRNFNLTLDPSASKKDFPEGEWVSDIKDISGMGAGTVSPGGGTITLGNASMTKYAYRIKGDAVNGQQTLDISNSLPSVRENQWVMLWDSADGRLAWYRIVGVGLDNKDSSGNPQPILTLDGPDWVVSQNATEKLIVIEGAIGAYTSTIELDSDPLWSP